MRMNSGSDSFDGMSGDGKELTFQFGMERDLVVFEGKDMESLIELAGAFIESKVGIAFGIQSCFIGFMSNTKYKDAWAFFIANNKWTRMAPNYLRDEPYAHWFRVVFMNPTNIYNSAFLQKCFKSFMAEVPVIEKPDHRFAEQITELVSNWLGPPSWKSFWLKVVNFVLKGSIIDVC